MWTCVCEAVSLCAARVSSMCTAHRYSACGVTRLMAARHERARLSSFRSAFGGTLSSIINFSSWSSSFSYLRTSGSSDLIASIICFCA